MKDKCIKIGTFCAVASIALTFIFGFSGSLTAIAFSAVLLCVSVVLWHGVEDKQEAAERRERARKRYQLLLLQDRENTEKAYRAAKISAEFSRWYQARKENENECNS